MSGPDSGVDLRTPSFWQRNDPEEPREELQLRDLRRNQPRNRLSSSSSSSGRSSERERPQIIGDMELNDPDILDMVLLEHEAPNPRRFAAYGEERQIAEWNEPEQIENFHDIRRLPTTPERPRSDFWPEGIWSWKCVDRCTQFVLSIALTIVGFAGGIFSLHYFERPLGWALMSLTTAGVGILLIRKSLMRLCCP